MDTGSCTGAGPGVAVLAIGPRRLPGGIGTGDDSVPGRNDLRSLTCVSRCSIVPRQTQTRVAYVAAHCCQGPARGVKGGTQTGAAPTKAEVRDVGNNVLLGRQLARLLLESSRGGSSAREQVQAFSRIQAASGRLRVHKNPVHHQSLFKGCVPRAHTTAPLTDQIPECLGSQPDPEIASTPEAYSDQGKPINWPIQGHGLLNRSLSSNQFLWITTAEADLYRDARW